eukprot:422623-Amorphochlora_amoeboformis.AAC.1
MCQQIHSEFAASAYTIPQPDTKFRQAQGGGFVRYPYLDLVIPACAPHEEFSDVPRLFECSWLFGTFSVDFLVSQFRQKEEEEYPWKMKIGIVLERTPQVMPPLEPWA